MQTRRLVAATLRWVTMRHYVNFSLVFFFATMVVTGWMRFLRPFDLVTTRVHVVTGFCLLVLVLLHLITRLGYFRAVVKRGRAESGKVPPGWLLLIVVAGLWALVIVASAYNWRPVAQLLEQGHEAKSRAIIFRSEPHTANRTLDNGFQVKRVTEGVAQLKIDVDWGPQYEVGASFADPFSDVRPQIAIWAEGPAQNLIETFYVSEESAYSESVRWDGNVVKRVNILPVWRHRFTLVSQVDPAGEMDAYSAATPEHSFSIEDYLANEGKPFYLNVEINVPDDTNEFYHSDQEETAEGYTLPGLGQPSLIYGAYIDPEDKRRYYLLELIGHGGSSREQDGKIFYNLDQITTADQVIDKVLVRVDFHVASEDIQ